MQNKNYCLRIEFEKLNKDSYEFRRSRRGTYVNSTIARDWKWFQEGAKAILNSQEQVIHLSFQGDINTSFKKS